MESARVRLPRPRNSSAYNDSARRLSNEEQRRSSFQRFTFPNITPPSVVQSQRRSSQQHVRASQYIGDHPGLVTPVKPVYKLDCRHCSTTVCARGMKAILLADTTIELYSTDTPSQSGNVIGYHVVSPCSQCLDACNNGHFWMFHSSACQPAERHDRNKQIMLWNNLPRAEMDMEFMMGTRIPYDQLCR
ncbi:hypothetical protein INT48_007297 [Thamnidium elegans]|uniref:Uncharacterized protein n=1 Tax=Thamnidium elegans TaxID=101142 RepID=A0A8H7SQN5_9FUNG|nr:hypothetical protein INT48_007297 [Thamnidium elegans]